MNDIAELIARLEAATGPDREIDALIACEFFFHELRPAKPDDHKEFQRGCAPGPGDIWCPTGFLMSNSYTSRIDDALKLLKPGYGAVSMSINERGQSSARIGHPYVYGNGATPAIALVIAALKSRTPQP